MWEEKENGMDGRQQTSAEDDFEGPSSSSWRIMWGVEQRGGLLRDEIIVS